DYYCQSADDRYTDLF
nr:immunoglobulin light chain junction region [Macaca mulatta]